MGELEDDGAEPVFQVAAILVLRIGHEDKYLSTVGQTRPDTNTLIVGKGTCGEVDLGAKLNEQFLA